MKRYLKLIALTLILLVILGLITIAFIVMFVSPNRLKPLLITEVMKQTSRQLIIDGDLSWTFFPYLGVKTGHMALSNPREFQQPWLVEIESATVSVRLLPLLKNKIQSNGITLHGLRLHLIKNAKGDVNWNFTQPDNDKKPQNLSQSQAPTGFPMAMSGLMIANIDVTDGQVTWTDEQAKQSASINDFYLKAKDISLLQPFPIEIGFNLNTSHPPIMGQFKINSELAVNATKKIISFRSFRLSADLQQTKQNMNVIITGDLLADFLEQTLQWSNFRAEAGQLLIDGQIRMTHLITGPDITGHLQLAPIDLRDWLKKNGQDVSHVQSLKPVTGDFDIASVKKAISIQGKFVIDDVQINHIKLTQVNIPIHFENNILNLSAIDANLYQGTLKTNLTIKLDTLVPQIAMNAQLANIQIGSLLDDLGGAQKKLKLNGTTVMDCQLTTVGVDSATMLKNLNGTSHLSISNGIIEGIDIRYYISLAKALLAQKAPTEANTNKTEFGHLTGSAIIKNGIVQNDDLVVTSSMFITQGKGTISLVDQQINYQTNTLINQVDEIKDIPVPISITGSLNAPKIRFESNVFTKTVTQNVIQKTKNSLKDKLKGQGENLLQNLLSR